MPAVARRPVQGVRPARAWRERLGDGIAPAWVATRDSLGSALLAATGGVVVMLAVRLLVGITTPTELVGDRITTLIPLGLFSALLHFFGQNAKHIFFGGLLVGQGVATAVLIAVYWGGRTSLVNRFQGRFQSPMPFARREPAETAEPASGAHPPRAAMPSSARALEPPMPRALDALGIAVWYWLVSLAILTPVSTGAIELLGSEIVPALVSGVLFVSLQSRRAREPAAAGTTTTLLSRRRVLRQAGFAAALLASTAAAWELIQRGAASLGLLGASETAPRLNLGSGPAAIIPPPTPNYAPWTPVAGQTPELTPLAQFYYVSKNLVGDPNLDATQWQLQISGMVDHPTVLSFAALRALPQTQRFQTLECISNEVGGNLMSTAEWTGTSLADIANAAGIQPGASQMIFRCADGYSDRHHLTQVLDPRALIVYAMDGQPLPQAHGYPARLLIPGRYGMKNGKWLTSLEFAPGNYVGYWEQQGWTPEAVVKLTSRIDVPGDGEFLPIRPLTLAGVAFAGDQEIARVDVSTDGGQTWTAAGLKRPLGALTWVLWELAWTPPQGTHVLVVRAIDGAGRVQVPTVTMPLPDGATGYHAISVTAG